MFVARTAYHTGEIEEIGLLMEVIEDCARSVLDVCGGEYSDTILWQLGRKLRPALSVFGCGNPRRDCDGVD